MAGANEVEIVVTSKDKSGPGFDSARRNASKLEHEGGGSADALSGKLKGLGVAAAAAAATIAVDLAVQAIGKLKDYAGKAIDAASNLNESFNAVDKVFKTSAQTIKDWGATQANAYGLSQRAFQEMATPLGALLKNQGVGQDKLAETTIRLTQRAADLASVFNTDVPDALDALTAGLRGETDPLERYGVSLNAAQVEAEALAETHKKTASQLTDQEKALARLNLIFKQTNDSAGDFKDTSNGLANSSRILAARQEELQAKIGQKLLPLMNKLNELKLQALEYLSNTVFPKVVAHLKDIYEGFRIVWEWAAPKVQAALEQLRKAWEDNSDKIEKLKPLLQALGVFIGVVLVSALGAVIGLATLFVTWLGYVGDYFDRVKQASNRFTLALLDAFEKVLNGAVIAFGWIPGIGDKLKGAQAKFNEFANNLRAEIMGIPDIDVNVVVHGAEAVGNVAGAIRGMAASVTMRNRAHGGVIGAIAGAASGGVRNGLVNVGEHGRELALLAPGPAMLPPGSTVIPNGATENALSGGGGGGTVTVVLEVVGGAGDALYEVMNVGLRTGKLRAFAKA